MKYVLTSGFFGYYSRKEPIFGTSGDFITSPEISQLFGEVIGCWLASKMRVDRKYVLVELGPGKGTLMRDVLLTLKSLKLNDSIEAVELLECSEHLRQVQKSTIEPLTRNLAHIDDLMTESYVGKDVLILAHEFFDALPVHVFKRNDTRRWSELLVDNETEGRFKFVCSQGDTLATKSLRVNDMFPKKFESLELSPECWSYANKISKIGQHAKNVSGLIVDYGNWGPSPGSLRAIWKHKLLDSPLERLGEADLSVDVDFHGLYHYLKKSYKCRFMTQGEFLMSCHIDERVERLSDTSIEKETLKGQRDRLLIDMGSVYKVLSFEKQSKNMH